jgi:hypothetical protein
MYRLLILAFRKINEVGKIKTETGEVNLNVDGKRFWIETLKNITYKIEYSSYPLNPQ